MPLVAFSQDAAPAVPEKIAVLIVDGAHHYEQVAQDLALYAPRLLPGGLIFIDDYNPLYPSVVRATDEYFTGRPAFRILHQTYFRGRPALGLTPGRAAIRPATSRRWRRGRRPSVRG